ncbi:hypothetical protein KKJ17_19515, partial [Xenorhabdus bovienii]|uniref:hypothetical protein n=1 Tax=Xenorhabdus bovienii TaxID=40576 RepID=UPI0023B2C1F3
SSISLVEAVSQFIVLSTITKVQIISLINLTLISASPILNNYIDPRTISRIVKKQRRTKRKKIII